MMASSTSNERLAELTSLASAKEAIKDYNSAADLYSQAVELQATLNGEMAVENADLLYSYGKCLYHIAVSKSDVFGSKVAVRNVVESAVSPGKDLPQPQNEESSMRHITDSNKKPDKDNVAGSAYFQFNGDENFEDEDDEENEDEDREFSEEEDDFENAFETLDMARVLLLRKLDITLQSCQGEMQTIAPAEIRKIKERLSDTYDLQAEISLEGERFPDAVADLRAALELKRELFPAEDSAIAECHYKLSLALEFSSITQPSDEGNPMQSQQVDFQMREEAAKHMQTAINCCDLRISMEERKLADVEATNTQELAKIKRYIDDVREIVSDMKQRLAELLRPPISPADSSEDADRLTNEHSVLNQTQSPAGKLLLEEAIKGANDLNALVRKRKRATSATKAQAPQTGEESAPPKQSKPDTT